MLFTRQIKINMLNEFQKLKEELIMLGEDKEELDLIEELFPILDEEAQKKVIENLKKELEDLKN